MKKKNKVGVNLLDLNQNFTQSDMGSILNLNPTLPPFSQEKNLAGAHQAVKDTMIN